MATLTLTDRINHIFGKLTSRGALTELEIKSAMREIRIALLEADVNLEVARDFINRITEKAVGEKILKSLTPGQQVVKIVHEELIALLGGSISKLNVSSKLPTVYLMCGLQGAGKTTMCGKLALHLKKQSKTPLLVACDIYRPAAIKQLEIVAQKVGCGFFQNGTAQPDKTAKAAIEHARAHGFDTVIIDTAGRLHINEELMTELKRVKSATDPAEVLLVADAMTGQDSVTVAKAFNEALGLTGLIVTKLDGDTRGGAVLSMRAATGVAIKMCGIGEKPEDLEAFHPDRMASRILGMGDVLTLIEKAQASVSQEEAAKMARKLKEMSFDLNDFLSQYDSISKMGGISDMLNMLPGASKLKMSGAQVDEKEIARNKAIILSMTREERTKPQILDYSRKRRVAAGSGTQVQDVNKLLKQYEQSKELMKRFKKGGRLPF